MRGPARVILTAVNCGATLALVSTVRTEGPIPGCLAGRVRRMVMSVAGVSAGEKYGCEMETGHALPRG